MVDESLEQARFKVEKWKLAICLGTIASVYLRCGHCKGRVVYLQSVGEHHNLYQRILCDVEPMLDKLTGGVKPEVWVLLMCEEAKLQHGYLVVPFAGRRLCLPEEANR